MRTTWLGLLATVAAAVLLTPAAWAAPRGHGGGGRGGYGGHASYAGRGGYAGYGRGYYGGGWEQRGDWNRGWGSRGDWDRGWARGWGFPGYYGYGWGSYPGYYSNYGAYPAYSDFYSYAPDYSSYSPDYYGYAPPASSYQSFYPPEAPAYDANVTPSAPAAGNGAVVNVRVPDPNAKVWFQGVLTNQTGTDRSYDSPPLDPNRSYTYDIRAEWNDNGRMVDQTRHVQVHAGDRVSVDFLAPAANETR